MWALPVSAIYIGPALAQRSVPLSIVQLSVDQSVGSFGLKVLDVIQGWAGLYIYLRDVDAVDGQTLIYQQPILIGWPRYIERLRQKVQAAVQEMGIPN